MAARREGERWWVRGSVLLALLVCAVLPLGALGTIDAGCTSSVVVPHSRAGGGTHGRAGLGRLVVRLGATTAVGDVAGRRTPLPGLVPHPPAHALALVLVALDVGATHLPAGHPAELGPPSRRGPPSYR